MTDEPRAYSVYRYFRDIPGKRQTVKARVTLTEAQAHCSDPETSSSTCTGRAGLARTRRFGAWFDGYGERR